MYYVGVDYHKEIAVACITDKNGKEKDILDLPATPSGMDTLIEIMKGKKFKVLGEAFTYSIDLHNYLIGQGVDSDLVRPTDFKLVTTSKKKTDRHDARTIAWYLRLKDKGEIVLNSSFIVKDEQMRFRDICRLRENLAEQSGVTSQRIRSHMRRNGEYLPVEVFGDKPKISSGKVQQYIIENYGSDFTLQELLREYIYYGERSKVVDTQMRLYNTSVRDVDLLMSIPGIGETTALELMSMIVDISRFPNADVMRSYFGMAPKVRDSGESVHHGHITKQGDPMMRKVLDRATKSHMRFCTESKVKTKYDSVVKRSPKAVAGMAAANKLLDVIFSVLVNKRPFRV